MGFLNNKRALIVGLASGRSIAAGIAEAMHREGAELAFSYQNDKLQSRVEGLAAKWNSPITLPLDVADDKQIEQAFATLSQHWDKFDILVHSVAFAPQEQLHGDYLDCVTRDGFSIAHDISSYSFAALAKAARAMLNQNGALITLSYLGAERAMPHYNVMGIAKASLEANVRYLANSLGQQGVRVNAISAGPIKTLAAAGIRDFRKMQNVNETMSPLSKNVTQLEVGNTAAFLCSDLASGITGEIVHVDAGFNMVGMGSLSE